MRLRSFAAWAGALLTIVSCSGSPSPSAASNGPSPGSPTSAPTDRSGSSVLPPLLDVPEYRGDSARTGVNPGPGPIAEPRLIWSRTAGELEFSPILADGVLLIGAGDGHFYGLDARTGGQLWVDPPSGSLGGINGFASAGDGIVVFSVGGGLRAIEVATGALQWEAAGKAGTITDIADGVVYSAANDGHVYGLDLRTGHDLWSWKAPAAATYVTVDDGVAYVSVGDGQVYAVSIDSGTVAWHVPTISQAGAVVVDRGVVFASARVDQGEVYAIDRSSGDVLWTYRPPSGLGVSLGPLADGVIYAGAINDGLFALPVAPKDPGHIAPMWHAEQAGSVIKGQALVGDILYVPIADPPGVIAVDTADGTIRWRLPLSRPAQGPVVSGGMLFVADQSGVISAYAEPTVAALIRNPATGPLVAAVPAAALPPDPYEIVERFDWATTGLVTPWSMDIGPDGLLYVLDGKPSVTVVDPATGHPVRSWGSQGAGEREFDVRGSFGNPGAGDLAVGPDGRVYVADSGNHRIQVFQSDGAFARQFGTFGTGPGQFSAPAIVKTDSDGGVCVVDFGTLTISKFGKDQGLAWRAKAPFEGDDSGRSPIHGLTILGDGRVAVFMDGGGPAALLDPTDGRYLGMWAPGLGTSQFGGSGEGRVDANGRVYVFTYVPYAEAILAPDGTVLGARSGRAGELFYPPPVIAPDGFGYSFDPFGLVRLKVMLPGH